MLAKVEEVAVGDLVSCREKTFSMLVVFTTFQITSKQYFTFSVFITYSPDQTSNPEPTNSEFIKRKLTVFTFRLGFC